MKQEIYVREFYRVTRIMFIYKINSNKPYNSSEKQLLITWYPIKIDVERNKLIPKVLLMQNL